MRGVITERTMFAFWLAGIEDQPERSVEICLAEIFGDAIAGDTAHIGMGIHKFRDPNLEEAFTTIPLQIDIAEHHTHAVDWRPGSLAFMVDGALVHRLDQAPDYPMPLMLGVLEFPGKVGNVEANVHVPKLVVFDIRGR